MEQVFHFIRSYNLLVPDDALLVAVSGGADSMALLSLMIRLRDQGGLKDLLCVHLNHGLRPDAGKDEAFVRATAAGVSVRCLCRRLNVKTYAEQHRCSIETAGRDCRLHALRDLALQHGCTAMATGHHKDDSAETLIQRLSRGTGFRGLCGIWPSRRQDGLRWIRPLLNVTHSEILHYLRTQKLTWCEDTTNRERRFRRNFIRHELLPRLQSGSRDDLVEALHDLSLTGYRCFHKKILPHAKTLITSAVSWDQDRILLDIPAVGSASPLVLSEVIRHCVSRLGCGEQAWTQNHYRNVIGMIKQGSPVRLSLPGHVHARRDRRRLILSTSQSSPSQVFPETPVRLALPGRTAFGPYLITTEYLTPMQYASLSTRQQRDRMIEVFDADRLSLPLTVRCKRPGDRFRPLGRGSERKVGRFLNRARVPAAVRERTVLICDGRAVIWVCPLRMNDHAKITSSSQRLVKIEVNLTKTDPENEDHSQTKAECR